MEMALGSINTLLDKILLLNSYQKNKKKMSSIREYVLKLKFLKGWFSGRSGMLTKNMLFTKVATAVVI